MKKAFIQLHIAVFLAGFTGILGRLITLNEALLVWYRMVISSIILWIVYYFKKNKTTHDQASNHQRILHWISADVALGYVLCGNKNFYDLHRIGLSFIYGVFYSHS